MERLQKVLAQAGIASRRKCESLIQEGRVRVNGEVVSHLGAKVNALQDTIEVDGEAVRQEKAAYVLLYKPLGVITSLSDPQGRPTVKDYVAQLPLRLFPVGRLDYQTEGLLLLTNDGALSQRMAHPRYKMDKVYIAKVKGYLSAEKLKALRSGIPLDGRYTAPAVVKNQSSDETGSIVKITIHEGRNRQVRRMFESLGHPVLALKRIQLGFLTLQGLRPGQWRHLTATEVSRLRHFCGLK